MDYARNTSTILRGPTNPGTSWDYTQAHQGFGPGNRLESRDGRP